MRLRRPGERLRARLVVACVALVAAVAAADAVRQRGGAAPAERREAEPQARGPKRWLLEPARGGGFVAAGPGLRTRVLRHGREHLSARAIAAAFPGPPDGLLNIARLAVAPDGALLVAAYRFPRGRPSRAALELWRGRRLLAAFPVASGSFSRGIAFAAGGHVIATFSWDHRFALYDRLGRRVAGVPYARFETG